MACPPVGLRCVCSSVVVYDGVYVCVCVFVCGLVADVMCVCVCV